VGRSRNDVDADELSNTTCRGGPGISRRLHRPDVTPDDRSHRAGAHLLPSHENHVGGFDHGVSRFDHSDEATGFDQPESVADLTLVLLSHSSAHVRSGSMSCNWKIDAASVRDLSGPWTIPEAVPPAAGSRPVTG